MPIAINFEKKTQKIELVKQNRPVLIILSFILKKISWLAL